MRILKRRPHRQFFALLTILSITFTQVCPAWALRPESGGSPLNKSGLEEALGGGGSPVGKLNDPLTVTKLALRRLDPTTPALRVTATPGELPPPVLIAAIWAGLTVLPEAQRTLSGKVSNALRLLQAFQTPGTRKTFDERAVSEQIVRIVGAAPEDCPTCAARGLMSIASSPEFGLSESSQSLEFQNAETVTALLIAVDVWLTGQVHSTEEKGTGHQVFANTLASAQIVYQAAEFGVESQDRRQWSSRQMGLSQLQAAVRQGPVLVYVGGDHFAVVDRIEGDSVVLRDVLLQGDGAIASQEVPLTKSDFLGRWFAEGQNRGYALVGTPERTHSIPGKTVPLREAKDIIGCCGVSNASGVDRLFSRSAASQSVVRVLESRGFDNYATARKMRINLPPNFNLLDPRNSALQERIQESESVPQSDIAYFDSRRSGSDGQPGANPFLRFFAVSRGVGSNTANMRVIESDMKAQVERMARLVYGDGVSVEQVRSSGHWDVLEGVRKIGEVVEEAAADHTRFKTKGGDRKENAHHWLWEGVSGGMNGDWEGYRLYKAILNTDHEEEFEGTTDSEVLFHVIGDLARIKDPQGQVIGREPLEKAVIRAFRFAENLEAWRQASVVLQPGYATDATRKSEQDAVRAKLEQLGIPTAKLAETVMLQGVKVPVFLRDFFNAAIKDPTLMDRLAAAENGWKGYYHRIGAQLPQTKEKHFDNSKSLNISINVLSLYDGHSAVVARTYDKSTAFSFGFGRDESTGQVEMILGGSELRGFAPLIGKRETAVPIRDGVVDLVNGKVEQVKAREWSVYTVDQTQLDRHDVWKDEVDRDLSGDEVRVKWTSVRPGQEAKHAEWTAFRLETTAQPITLYLTIDALTAADESGARTVHLGEATDRTDAAARQLRNALANPETKVFGGGSGTSYHALLNVDARYHLFDGLQSSDLWLSGLIRNQILYEVAQGRPPVFVVVSQSGETGAAINLAKELIKLGAIVIGVTNRPGSSIYTTTKEAGGVVTTESLDETAVAATGSNSSQVAALEFIAMKRVEALTPPSSQMDVQARQSARIGELVGLTTYILPDGEGRHIGALQGTLDSFGQGQPNQRVVNEIVDWIKASGLEETIFGDKTAFRNTNLLITGIGPVAQALAPEIGLKVMEVTRKTAAFVPVQELLAHTGRPEQFDPQTAIRSVEENLKRFTTGGEGFVGKYPHFQTLGRDDPRLSGASEILLLADGESQVALDYIVARYQTASPVPVKRSLYASASSGVRKGALVIAVQPWTEEQARLLEKYRAQGATVVVIATPAAKDILLHQGAVEQARSSKSLIETAGPEWKYAQVTVLDLFLMRVMEALQRRILEKKRELQRTGKLETSPLKDIATDYARPEFLAQEVGHMAEQIEGMRTVVDSFDVQRPGGRHRNAITLERLNRYYKTRGWNHFDWWATGKGTRYAAARDLSLLAWARIGKVMATAEGSEFKHGYSAATNIGDNFFNVWSRKGTPDWGDDVKTVLEELVPRVADYPYPVFQDREPGFMTLLAQEDPNDEYLVHLSDAEYDRLRALRRDSKQGKVQGGGDTNRPDGVFVTPHGGFLEQLTLNRMLIQGAERSLGEYLAEQGRSREEVIPRTMIVNIDIGETLPGKQGIYTTLRSRFPSGPNRIVTITEAGNRQAAANSDSQIIVNHHDPIAFLVVGHQLTTQLVEARFGHVLKWLVDLNHALQEEIKKGGEGIIGRFAPEVTTPGELFMGWALQEPNAYRALQEFSRSNPRYHNLETELKDILDWYNLDPIKGMGAADNINELQHATVDLIEKLAKVVTNASGIRLQNPAGQGPVTLAAATLGLSDPQAVVFEPTVLEGISGDPEVVDQLREILVDRLAPAALERITSPQQIAEAFIAFAGPALVEAVSAVRGRHPGAPASIPVEVQIHGERLAHQTDGRVFVNIQAFRHPLLLQQQIEHELNHELLGGVAARVDLPPTFAANAPPDLRRALEELVVLRAEAGQFFAYTPEGQHEVLEILQGPNAIDPSGEFDDLLRQLRSLPRPEWAAVILDFIRSTRPELAAGAEALSDLPTDAINDLMTTVAEGIVDLNPVPAPFVSPQEVDHLRTELRSRGRTVLQIAHFLDLFRTRVLTRQETSVRTIGEGQYVSVYAVFPYREPRGVPNPTVGIGNALRDIAQRERQPIQPHDLFITTFRDTPADPPVALLRLELNSQPDADFVAGQLGELLAPYTASGSIFPISPVVPADFLPELRVNLDRHVGTAVLGQVFDMAEEVYQGGDPRIVVVPDQVNGGSVVLAIAPDRIGLTGDIGSVLAQLDINIDRQGTDNYLPDSATPSQSRVSVSFYSIAQPVDVIRGMGVETALESVLGASPVVAAGSTPTAVEFRRAVAAELVNKLRLPDPRAVETLTSEAGRLFDAYAGNNRPQAQAFPYPGDPSKSIVIALDTDRQGLLDDVLIPVSREAEANLMNTDGTKVGDISFLILVVQDRGPAQIEAAVRRVRRRLEGARMPPAFEDHMRSFLDRMPRGSLRSIYGKVRGIAQDPNEPNEVIPSLNVLDSNSQTAITFVVRQNAVPGLKAQFLSLVGLQGLWVVRAEGPEEKQMLVETDYAEPDYPEPVHILRAVVNAPRDSAQVNAILTAMETEFHLHLAGGLEETLADVVPLEQVPVTYPASGAPDFTSGNVQFLFVSLVAGRATRWEKSITDAKREAEFAVTDPVSGQPVIRSKVLTSVTGVPGFPADEEVPVGWMPISAAKALGGKAIAIVGHQKELVIREFSRRDGSAADVSFAEQRNLDGTGGALWRALAVSNLRQAPELPVVVGAGDQPLFDATFFGEILAALTPGVDLVVGTSTVSAADAQGKGRIVRHKTTGAILGILEQRDIAAIKAGQAEIPPAYRAAGWTSGDDLDAINEINTGVYSVRVGTMEQALSGVTNQNAQKQFYATDMVSESLKQGKVVSSVDVPAWRMPDVTTVNDLPGVVTALGQHPELRFTAGLEEVPALSPLELALPSRWPSFDEVVNRLNGALTSSDFLKTVRESLRQAEGVLPGYRVITRVESEALKKNGVVAEDWDNVYVPVDGLTTGDARRMRNLRLLGTVYLGHLKGNVRFSDGTELPSEISNSALRNVVMGNNVLIKDNILVERYVIGDGAVVTQNRKLTAEQGTDFGIGKPIPIGPETGGREIKTYPEILLGDVVRLVRSPGDKEGRAKYDEALARYLEAAKSDFGYIGRGAEVSGVADGKNLFVADGGVVVDNTNVHGLVLLSAEGERSVLAGTSEVVNLTAQPGVEIIGANMVAGIDEGAHGVLMLEHSHAGNGATIKDSVIAPNTGVEKGEVTSSLMGPFIGMHHDSLVIAMDWADGMGNVGAGVRKGSNHTGRAPDQEFREGEGNFLGLASIYSFSGNSHDSPYTIFGKGVSMLPSRMAMPFSLVQKPTVQIPGESPESMEISPGWVWFDNAYMPMRNEGKYASRDKSSRNGLKATGKEDPLLRRTPFEILRPDTINQMIRARDVLAAVNPRSVREWVPPQVDGQKLKPIRYYTGAEIPQLGKTFVQEEALINGRDTYTAMIQYYGAKGLWAEVQKLAAAGRLSEVRTLLTTPSTDLRWEHERRVLLQELPGKSVPDILRFLVESQRKLADQVRTSKEKDDKRGERLLDDYRETHTAAANDKFVKQSAAAAVKLQQEVEALLPQLSGLEEASTAVTEVERGILPESDTAVGTGIKAIVGPHVSALAIGAALSRVTTRDGQAAAQVVFVVENAAEADLVNREASPLMVFSASEYGGSLEAALSAARDFLQGATELGTDGRPVPQTIQQILRNLFGIELAFDSIAIWNSFIERVTGALSTQL